MSFLGVLLAVLVGLKLAGVTDVSWWVVLSPLYVWCALILVLGIAAAFKSE